MPCAGENLLTFNPIVKLICFLLSSLKGIRAWSWKADINKLSFLTFLKALSADTGPLKLKFLNLPLSFFILDLNNSSSCPIVPSSPAWGLIPRKIIFLYKKLFLIKKLKRRSTSINSLIKLLETLFIGIWVVRGMIEKIPLH